MSNSVRDTTGWTVRAKALADAFPIARLHPRVLAEIEKSSAAEGWCIAFSGGADSLAMLLLLWAHWPQGRSCIHALHFNHRLRGSESDADAMFCREVCSGLGVPLQEGSADWPHGPKDVSEAEAREARLAFFKGAMAGVGSRLLFLGHHKDDVAETMLMRLARGSGTAGLAAPRPVSRHGTLLHLRPLMGIGHSEILDALNKSGANWREDATNFGERYFRSRIRSTVIPALRAAAPSDFVEGATASRELLQEDDEALEAWADRVAPDCGSNPLPATAVRESPRAVARRVLQRWLASQGGEGSLGRVAFDELLSAIRAGGPVRRSVGSGAFVVADDSRVFWEIAAGPAEAWAPCRLAVPGRAVLPDGGVLEAELVSLNDETRQSVFAGRDSGPFGVYLGFEEAPPAWFAVRSWKPGDRFAPLGSIHESKLQDHFTNRRIPKGMRHRLPVITDSAERMLWVPGLPPAEFARVLPGAAFAVRLTYKPSEPLFDSLHV